VRVCKEVNMKNCMHIHMHVPDDLVWAVGPSKHISGLSSSQCNQVPLPPRSLF
jgi:hypothetical protein